MANPGVAGSQIPAGEDWLVRRVADLERTVRELGPSVAASFKPVIDDLLAKQAALTDLLTKVVRTDAIYANASNFGLTTGSVTKVSLTITVPVGFTKAAVSVIGRVFAINNNTTGGSNGTGGDYLYADARIAGQVGLGLPLPVTGSNNSNMNVAPYAYVLTGLTPGGTFTILVNAATSFLTWVAQASNKADLTGTIGWSL